MKAWMAVAMLGTVSLVGCGGNSRELQRARIEANTLRKDTDTLKAENEALKQKVSELETELASANREREELKAAAAAAAAEPAVVPATGKKRPARK